MEIVAANDQENLVHTVQPGAGGKPLRPLRPLGAKTPAHKPPKTPFKVPLNNENALGKGGKSLSKTFAGKLDSNAFVTPAG